jgi:hypothetical protein
MNRKILVAGMAGCAFLVTAAVSPALASAKALDNGQFVIENDTTQPMIFTGFTDTSGTAEIFAQNTTIEPGTSETIGLFLNGRDSVSNTANYEFADQSGAMAVHMTTYNGGAGNSAFALSDNGKYTWHSNPDDLPTYKLYVTPK